MDLISIIVPVYNMMTLLRRCLNSILNQSYYNLEIILINDESTDDSGSICEEYCRKDNRITVIHKKNGGLSAARNTGINLAKGKYIAFIDSDDFVHKDYIKILYNFIVEFHADIAICDYEIGNGNVLHSYDNDDLFYVTTSENLLKTWHYKNKKIETVVWNKLYKRELFNNIRFPEGYSFEDIHVSHLLIAAASKVVIVKRKLYYYYQRSDSIIHTITKAKIQEGFYAQNVRIQYFKDQGYENVVKRLNVKKLKFCMRNYFIIQSSELKEYKNTILQLYQDLYKEVKGYSDLSFIDKTLLYIFHRGNKVGNIFFHMLGTIHIWHTI